MNNIISLYQSPHLYDACMNFLCAYFIPDTDLWKTQFSGSTESNDTLPQGYMLIKDDKIIGFCGLLEKEMIRRDDLSPFISPLVIAPEERGNELGAALLEHARKEAGRLGFYKLYLTTDHIGYYEKYGFREFGLTLFNWGRPTKIYAVNSIGVQKLTGILREKYPDAKAILLGGSLARNEITAVQDIDVKIIVDGSCDENGNGDFYGDSMLDVSYTSKKTPENIEELLKHPYCASFYNDAILLYDRDGDMGKYIAMFKEKFAKKEYLKCRIDKMSDTMKGQYDIVSSACETGDEADIHCRFATYTWCLSDALLIRNLSSPTCIRSLQRLRHIDKAITNRIIDAEGHRHLVKSQLAELISLYEDVWKGDFWTYNGDKMKWMISNNLEAEAYHGISIFYMMGIENSPDKQELFAKWQAVTGKNHILPMKSLEEFKNFHSEMMDYLPV